MVVVQTSVRTKNFGFWKIKIWAFLEFCPKPLGAYSTPRITAACLDSITCNLSPRLPNLNFSPQIARQIIHQKRTPYNKGTQTFICKMNSD